MFQYRQVLVRLLAGDSVLEVARSGLMGCYKLGELRSVAQQHGWLDTASEVPDDAAIVAALGQGWRVRPPGLPAFTTTSPTNRSLMTWS